MKDPVLDLLRAALIPELSSDISTGSSCNIHLILITVTTIRTFPYKLSIIISYNLYLSCIAAYLTIIAFCIKLCIHNIVIYELHNRKNCWYIIIHIWNFYIAYCTTW